MFSENLSQNFFKKGLGIWLSVKALGSMPSTEEKKDQRKLREFWCPGATKWAEVWSRSEHSADLPLPQLSSLPPLGPWRFPSWSPAHQETTCGLDGPWSPAPGGRLGKAPEQEAGSISQDCTASQCGFRQITLSKVESISAVI